MALDDIRFGSRNISGIDKVLGKEHAWYGTTSRDLILKTKGKVKILWAGKFIDIIRNGELNVDIKDPFTAYETKDDIKYSQDGLVFVIDEKAFYLVYDGLLYPISASEGEYVSYKTDLITTFEDKQRALKNIGLVYANEDEVTSALENGEISTGLFVYILGDGMYMIDESRRLYNPYFSSSGGQINGKLIINTSDTNIIEAAAGKNILIGSTTYSDSGISFVNNFLISPNMVFDGSRLLILLTTTVRELVSLSISSPDFVQGEGGFGIYTDENGNMVVEADRFISRSDGLSSVNSIDGTDNFYIAQWATINAVVEDEETTDSVLTLSKQIFEVGNVGRVSYLRNISVNPNDPEYDQYIQVFNSAYLAYKDGTNTYTQESLNEFMAVISAYNSTVGSVVDPGTGESVDIRINITNEEPIYLPENYNGLEVEDLFDFKGKVVALQNAMSKLESSEGDYIDVTISNIDGLNVTVTLNREVELSELVGRRIFRLKGTVIRMSSEKESSNFDLYTTISTLSDINDDHINTRIGDVEKLMPRITGYTEADLAGYLTSGVLTEAIYSRAGVTRSDNNLIIIDFTKPENTIISNGVILSLNSTIKIDLANNTIVGPNAINNDQLVTLFQLNAAIAAIIGGTDFTARVNTIIRSTDYVNWLKTLLGL